MDENRKESIPYHRYFLFQKKKKKKIIEEYKDVE